MRSSTNNRSYSELITIPTFEERLEYLRISGNPFSPTFGSRRALNQYLYQHSIDWKRMRREVIIRDHGCDLGVDGYDIFGSILVHHINPITEEDIRFRRSCVLDPENLISTSFDTHQDIHYGQRKNGKTPLVVIERCENDTCPWK